MKMQPIWVLINCNSDEEGEKIGGLILQKRLGSCFDIFPRKLTKYFWPPKSGEIEKAGGCLLVIETLENKYKEVAKTVKTLHSDQLPFIGYIQIHGVSNQYLKWLQGELK
jgi:uncharacterized protein involved in tolerance to divalent cations